MRELCGKCSCGQRRRRSKKECYIQPTRPESFAPRRVYEPACIPLDSNTTYKLSYRKNCGDMRPMSTKPIQQFHAPHAPMSGDTTHKMSYLASPGGRRDPFIPCDHDLSGKGPIQDITTQKHDYVPKPSIPVKNYKPSRGYKCPGVPMADTTTNRLSYQPLEKIDQMKSFAPIHHYVQPCQPMNLQTVHKASYQPVDTKPIETPPWAIKTRYGAPTVPFNGDTTYKLSYFDNPGDNRRAPIRPLQAWNPVSIPFDDNTVYKSSYLPACAKRPPLAMPMTNLERSKAAMDTDTVNKLSYQPNPYGKRTPMVPCDHDLGNYGPMQDITTQKHDYVPKPMWPTRSYKPIGTAPKCDVPFEDSTTSKLSYGAPPSFNQMKSFKPHSEFVKPCQPMNKNTTYNLSYIPNEVEPRKVPIWALKQSYKKPTSSFSGNTIYQQSYVPPGEDCTDYDVPGDTQYCQCDDDEACLASCNRLYPTACL